MGFLPFKKNFFKTYLDEDYPYSITKKSAFYKHQIQYLYKYLVDIDCKTLLIENEYIDHDYLDDYSNYYSKCFTAYNKRCKRIHFWNVDFSALDLRNTIINNISENIEKITNSYLGFVVMKPLPQAIIGRTVLSTYNDDGNKRFFPVTREYKVNLFGLELKPIKPTLASQEQDTVLAACATTALWTAFHKTSELFQTSIPTPSDITKSATKYIHNTRPIPTHGLNIEQMCYAISENKLVPEVYQIREDTPVNSIIYSYIRAGIPVILGYRIIEMKGLHAVTITGYRMEENEVVSTEVVNSNTHLPMSGLFISEFYSNDDNLGPFSRLNCIDKSNSPYTTLPNKRIFIRELDLLSYKEKNHCQPDIIIVPLYHKIRIKFSEVKEAIFNFNYFMEKLQLSKDLNGNPIKFTWDIRVIDQAEFKNKIINSVNIDRQEKEKLLFKSLPKYSWISTATYDNIELFSLITDATDLGRSICLHNIVFYNSNVKSQIKSDIQSIDKATYRQFTSIFSTEFKNFINNNILD